MLLCNSSESSEVKSEQTWEAELLTVRDYYKGELSGLAKRFVDNLLDSGGRKKHEKIHSINESLEVGLRKIDGVFDSALKKKDERCHATVAAMQEALNQAYKEMIGARESVSLFPHLSDHMIYISFVFAGLALC